jgi:hypothetical protein
MKAQFEGELWDGVTEKRIGETGYMIACNPEGKMVGITEAAISDRLQEETPYTGEVELPETEDEISKQITEFYGEKCYVSAVKRKGYYLIAAYPVKDANSLRNKYNALMLITLVVVLSVLFVVLYVLMKKHVVCEVSGIHGTLKKITEGDLDEKADSEGSLEFHDLSNGINETVSNLKERIQAAKGEDRKQGVADDFKDQLRNLQFPFHDPSLYQYSEVLDALRAIVLAPITSSMPMTLFIISAAAAIPTPAPVPIPLRFAKVETTSAVT